MWLFCPSFPMHPQLQVKQQAPALMWLFCPSRLVLYPQLEARQQTLALMAARRAWCG